jgi:hypothetical protein
MFPCSPTLNGCLYPNPGNRWSYILDFLDNHGTRVYHTGLNIYNRDVQGRGGHKRLGRANAPYTADHQGTIDFFRLGTAQVVEIADGNDHRLTSGKIHTLFFSLFMS